MLTADLFIDFNLFVPRCHFAPLRVTPLLRIKYSAPTSIRSNQLIGSWALLVPLPRPGCRNFGGRFSGTTTRSTLISLLLASGVSQLPEYHPLRQALDYQTRYFTYAPQSQWSRTHSLGDLQ